MELCNDQLLESFMAVSDLEPGPASHFLPSPVQRTPPLQNIPSSGGGRQRELVPPLVFYSCLCYEAGHYIFSTSLTYYMVALKLSGDLESILFTDVAPEPGLFWAYIHVKCMNARMHDPDSVFALFSLCCLLTDF